MSSKLLLCALVSSAGAIAGTGQQNINLFLPSATTPLFALYVGQ